MANPRQPTPDEQAVLDRLLESPFPGSEQIGVQLAHARVTTIEEYSDNYGSVEFEIEDPIPAAVLHRVPVMGYAYDSDRVPIEFLLHVVDGIVTELEIVKMDGGPIIRRPLATDLRILRWPHLSYGPNTKDAG